MRYRPFSLARELPAMEPFPAQLAILGVFFKAIMIPLVLDGFQTIITHHVAHAMQLVGYLPPHQPRSQGLSSLPPMSLRQWVISELLFASVSK